jgi:RNA polymerase sigma factor (sigma-70 family)
VQALSERLVRRFYDAAGAERWALPIAAFGESLSASVARGFGDRTPEARDVEQYIARLHLEDLALASACVAGIDAAWEQLMREQRPGLYRAADALDPTGRARELADALWADLFRNVLRYYHGRSSLSTWLRTVLAQRHVDAVRASKRLEPLPDEAALPPMLEAPSDPERRSWHDLVQRALEAAVSQLEPRDRLRLACYHAQQLTLAEIGRLLSEHEATVSRRLAKSRNVLRRSVEHWLVDEAGLQPAEVQRCIEAVLDDPGPLDIGPILAASTERKMSRFDRSKRGTV